MNKHLHGSPEVWDEVWRGADKDYSEDLITQNQVFEHVKIEALKRIFPQRFSMLEVGCGTAYVSLYFAKRGNNITCVDINKVALDIAKSNFKKQKASGKFVLASAESLPFADNHFDVVSSFGLMEHFEDPRLAFTEMARVLKPGGVLFADIVPNRFSVQTFGNIFNLFASFCMGLLRGKPREGWQKGIRNVRPLYFESNMGCREYKKIIESVGIKKMTVRGNRPVPRLTLPLPLDKIYAKLIILLIPLWRMFDGYGGALSRFWGAGLWFWGTK